MAPIDPRSRLVDPRTRLIDPRVRLAALSRRRFLQGSALAGLSAFAAACTPSASSPRATGTAAASAGASGSAAASAGAGASLTPTGPLQFANWDAYIDVEDDGVTSPTLVEFQEEYGVEVEYANAEIEDNATFVATIRPQLESNVPTGWDLIVLTDWMAAKIVESGWAEKIDQANVPDAAANLRQELRGLSWDPNQDFHYPWQSGATGIGYNVESTGRELTKVEDLFDPAFKGRVTLLSEVRDTFPLIHLMLQAQGKASSNPAEEMTVEDAQVVHDFLKPFVDSGHIRAFTGNEYLADFASGDTSAAIVWSGDLASSAGENDRFVYPEEGSMIWTDNLMIPKGAENKYTAELMINWVYDVQRAARLANYIYYISPVEGVADAITELDPEAGDNPLLFPPAEVTEKQHEQPNWDEETEQQINELFADLTGV
jgi:spermidine/putrescine transport system substrate-binding protein